MKSIVAFRAPAALLAVVLTMGAASAADAPKPMDVAKALSEAYADLFEKVSPAVVSIRTLHVAPGFRAEDEKEGEADGEKDGNAPRRNAPGRPVPDGIYEDGEVPDLGLPEDLLRRFFGEGFTPGPGQMPRRFDFRNQPPPRSRGQGSGVIIDTDGHILTNNHVVDGATKIEVSLANGDEAEAEFVAADKETDLAILRLKKYEKPVTAAPLGDSEKLRTGNLVVAIGSPFGRQHSMSSGIVSGMNRTLRAIQYERYLQTDAAINPGNSGGPLLNLDGEVVGINTIINTRGGGSEGVGFAVPSNMAKNVARQLIDKGHVTRGWLGITMRDLEDLKLVLPGVTEGAFVVQVHPDGPAAACGIQRDDVIVAVDGKRTPTSRDLQECIADIAPNSNVKIEVLRFAPGADKPESVTLEGILAERTPEVLERAGARNGVDGLRNAPRENPREDLFTVEGWGLTLRAKAARDKALGAEPGVVVARVDPRGPAAEAGLARDMLVVEVNRQPVPDLDAARAAFEANKDKDAIMLFVETRTDGPAHIVLKKKD